MDSKLKDALALYEKLKNEWNRKPPNVAKADELLIALKVCFFFLAIISNKIYYFLGFIR